MAKTIIEKPEEMVQIPRSVFEKFIDLEEAIEDWLMSQDEDLIAELRQAKKDAKNGKFIPWEQAKRRLHIT
jgi:hypothetical protein